MNKKYYIRLVNTSGIYYVKYTSEGYKGTTNYKQATKFGKELLDIVLPKIKFNGNIELAIA